MTGGPAHPSHVLVFRVGEARLATDVAIVREVTMPGKVQPVSFLPEFLEGVQRFRGWVIPIIDLRRRFGAEGSSDRKKSRLILLGLSGHILGALVDEVFQVVPLAPDSIRPPPPMAEGLGPRFLRGVFQHEREAVFLVDLRDVLTGAERVELTDLVEAGRRLEESSGVDLPP